MLVHVEYFDNLNYLEFILEIEGQLRIFKVAVQKIVGG